MRRTSSASSTSSRSASASSTVAPMVSRQWGTSREVDVEKQLFQRAHTALVKLSTLPDFGAYQQIAAQPASQLPTHLQYSLDVVPSEYLIDPVSLIRRLLRLGAPLSLAFNAVAERRGIERRLEVLSTEDALDVKRVKRAIYRFCEACVQDLGLKLESDLFTISQIFSDSTGDIVYPLHTLEMLFTWLAPEQNSTTTTNANTSTAPGTTTATTSTNTANGSPRSGHNSGGTTPSANSNEIDPLTVVTPSPAAAARSSVGSSSNNLQNGGHDQRSKVVDELLQTERKYVQDLETLLVYHDEMLAIGIPRETVAKICPGLPKLVEFQRRFLVGCEFQAQEFSGANQNFGWLFLHMRSGFEVYKTYTLGQKEATQTAIADTAALMPLSHILEPLYELPATLLKPVQRILRYPLLLKEILKHTPPSWPHYHELQSALAAMHEMMYDVNETQRRAENQFLSRELQDRVKDWKGLELSSMGELLLSGVFPVTSMGDAEHEYSLFLFEKVLLCCRDRAPTQTSTKKTPLTKIRPSANSASSAASSSSSSAMGGAGGGSNASRNSQGRSMSLELKGRIYLGYVTSVNTIKLPTGGYLLRLGWGYANDASEHGGFDVRLANEELAQMWESTIQRLAAVNRVGSNRSSWATNTPHHNASNSSQVSASATPSNARSSQTSLNQFGRWITTNVGSIDEDFASGNSTGGSISRRPSSSRHSSNGGIHFWDESMSTPSSSVDALRKLSISSVSSQQSASGGSGASRYSFTIGGGQPGSASVGGSSSGMVSSSSLMATPTAPSNQNTNNSMPNLRISGPRFSKDSTASLASPGGQRKVRVHIQGDTFLILVPPDLKFEQLINRVERKLKLCGKISISEPSSSLKFEYIDEDDDRVQLESDEDLLVAFEAVPDNHELFIYVTI